MHIYAYNLTLTCCVYIKGHIKTVDTKDQINALSIVYAMLFVNTVNTKIKACNVLNAMFVDTVNTGVCGSIQV